MVRFEFLEALGVVAGMSDVSDGDCALHENPECLQNRVRVVESCDLDPTRLVVARQIHGKHVAAVDAGAAGIGRTPAAALADTDGLATAEPGLVLTVTVADCVPLFLVDAAARAIALVHAGRVGTELAIAAEAMWIMEGLGASPERIYAYVGPSAGVCCYEVGDAMAGQLRAKGMVVRGAHVDLWESNVAQLLQGRLLAEHIGLNGRCTICDGQFYSHRTDGSGRRNMAFLALRE